MGDGRFTRVHDRRAFGHAHWQGGATTQSVIERADARINRRELQRIGGLSTQTGQQVILVMTNPVTSDSPRRLPRIPQIVAWRQRRALLAGEDCIPANIGMADADPPLNMKP